MQKIWDAINALLDFIASLPSWLVNLVKGVFLSLFDLIKDGFYWVFDTALGNATSAMGGIDTTGINNYLSSFGSLPAEILNVCGLLHMGTCMTIIGTAIVIRIVLQLIPFVRLGS